MSNSSFPLNSRRRFVKGLAAGGVLLGLSSRAMQAVAQAAETPASPSAAPVLTGKVFDLVIAESPVNFTGKQSIATTINGSLPGPTLRWKEGDMITINVTNKLREHTSIHWHGIILPFQMDGVPGISFAGIAP
ncbi:multicopper oxidase domain-containing protein, partial [Cutibacterium acnes]